MKKIYLIGAFAVAAVACFAIYENNFSGHSEDPAKMFEALDKNDDNNISIGELREYYKENHHNVLDDDQDNTISFQEAKEEGRSDALLDVIDTNDDNKISFEEGFKVEKDRFAAADEDKDGKVSKAEFDLAVKEEMAN
jgi:Ca2+-binding EF-hand superfamily protein